MKKRIFSLLCVLAVALVFVLTAQVASLPMRVVAEDETSSTKKQYHEEQYNTEAPTTQPSTQPSTTKEDVTTTKAPEPTSEQKTTDPRFTLPTLIPPKTEKEEPPQTETPSEKETTTGSTDTTTQKKDDNKKNDKKTTTTFRYVPTTTRATVPHITIPKIDNTTMEGTTLSPLDAYFERISGDSNTFSTVFEEQTEVPEQDERQPMQLNTISIVAICLGGIALVTVALTAGFAIRNKRANDDEEIAADYEQNAYGEDDYDETAEPDAQANRPQVDESESFTVVSLDDKDYTD